MRAARSWVSSSLLCCVLVGVSARAQAKKPDDNVVAPEQHGVDGRGNRALMPDDEELPPDGPAGEFGIANSWAFSSDAALLIQRATQSQVSGAVTSVTLAPATDIFLVRNLSVG